MQGDNSVSASNIQVVENSFVLSVTNVQPADVGEYVCEGSHGVGQLIAHLKLRGTRYSVFEYCVCYTINCKI